MQGRAVLVDTMVIVEAYRTGCWRGLSARFQLETVEKCVEETQTGAHKRPRDQWIDEAQLRERLHAVHAVTDSERANAHVRNDKFAFLDPGERDLWAHALGRADAWVLCGPDIASLRLGVRLGLRDRLVALEALLDEIGQRPREALGRNYGKKWHGDMVAKIAVEEGVGPA